MLISPDNFTDLVHLQLRDEITRHKQKVNIILFTACFKLSSPSGKCKHLYVTCGLNKTKQKKQDVRIVLTDLNTRSLLVGLRLIIFMSTEDWSLC